MRKLFNISPFATLLLLFACAAIQPAKAQQYQFGFLSYKDVLYTMPEYSKAQTALQSLKKKYEEEAQYNEEKFKRMFADYLQGQKGFPEQIMLKRQKELQIAMEQGISFRSDAQKLLSKAEEDLMKPLQQKLDSVLYLIGKENGLLFIGNTDNHNYPFIHPASGLDITQVVLARLTGKIIPINVAQGVKNSAEAIKPENEVPADGSSATPENQNPH